MQPLFVACVSMAWWLQGAIIISGVITLFDYKTAIFLAKVRVWSAVLSRETASFI